MFEVVAIPFLTVPEFFSGMVYLLSRAGICYPRAIADGDIRPPSKELL